MSLQVTMNKSAFYLPREARDEQEGSVPDVKRHIDVIAPVIKAKTQPLHQVSGVEEMGSRVGGEGCGQGDEGTAA